MIWPTWLEYEMFRDLYIAIVIIGMVFSSVAGVKLWRFTGWWKSALVSQEDQSLKDKYGDPPKGMGGTGLVPHMAQLSFKGSPKASGWLTMQMGKDVHRMPIPEDAKPMGEWIDDEVKAAIQRHLPNSQPTYLGHISTKAKWSPPKSKVDGPIEFLPHEKGGCRVCGGDLGPENCRALDPTMCAPCWNAANPNEDTPKEPIRLEKLMEHKKRDAKETVERLQARIKQFEDRDYPQVTALPNSNILVSLKDGNVSEWVGKEQHDAVCYDLKEIEEAVEGKCIEHNIYYVKFKSCKPPKERRGCVLCMQESFYEVATERDRLLKEAEDAQIKELAWATCGNVGCGRKWLLGQPDEACPVCRKKNYESTSETS